MTTTTTTTRRAILAGAAALPAIATTALASPSPDPIFAAIDTHKAGCAALDKLTDVDDETLDAYMDAEFTSLEPLLLDCRPTTLGGVAALLRHIGWYADRQGSGLFCNYHEECGIRRAGGEFLQRVADRIEALAVRS